MRVRPGLVLAAVFASLLVPSGAPGAPNAPNESANRHWIGVRERGDVRELFDRRSGNRFVPRGSNLLMKVREGDHWASSLFRPRNWNQKRVRKELTGLKRLGYNTVRVFIDLCQVDCISTSGGSIRRPFAKNIAAFLRIARKKGLVVMLASNDVPDRGYSNRLPCCSPFGGYRNSLWLTRKGHNILMEYWAEVVRALRRERAPLQVVIYQLQQEHFLLEDVEPLSLAGGFVTTADGETYDMADPQQKTEMVESNVRLAARRARAAIRRLDPGALVTMGFFARFDGDPRVVPSQAMLESSALDLVDLHLYPGVGHDLQNQVDAIGLSDAVEKPVVMGEFGAFRFAYANPRVGAYSLAHWQADSCAFGFDGWLTWLWAKDDDEVFGTREGGGVIGRQLSPVLQPDPCSAEGVPANLALGASATASASLPEGPPGHAIDGLFETGWGAGGFPPQWIQIDLGAVRSVHEIYLAVDQFPAGDTRHRLLLAGADGVFTLADEFEGRTEPGDVLSFRPPVPVTARFVRVETLSSPSWVGWHEIQVYGE